MIAAVLKFAETIGKIRREDPERENEKLQERYMNEFREALIAMTKWWWEDEEGADIAERLFGEVKFP